MAGRRLAIMVAACAGLVLPWLGLATPAGAAPAEASPAGQAGCSAGAHTLSPPGSYVRPADLPGRSGRAGRPGPGRPRGVRVQPGRGPV